MLGNMGNMMKKVQKMQQEMAKLQEELKLRTVEAGAGGGAVKVVMSGEKLLSSIKIDPSLAEDIEMLEDLIVVAVNEAVNKAEEMMTQEMAKVTGGLKLPGM